MWSAVSARSSCRPHSTTTDLAAERRVPPPLQARVVAMHTCWCASTLSLQDARPACPCCCVQMALVEEPNPADGEKAGSELQGRDRV